MHHVTEVAIAAVGPDLPTDWELRPERHIESLNSPVIAEPLVQVLRGPDVGRIVDHYLAANGEAITAQAAYKRWARISAIASLLAVVIASIMLLPRVGAVDDLAITIAATAQFALLATSFLASLWLAWRKPYDSWMRKRAEAENARMELFKHVIRAEAPSESGGALPLLPLQLEYFRRFHLNVQRLYFRERGEQHRRSVRRRFVWRCVALLLIVAAAFPIIWTLQGRDCIPLWIANCLTLLPSKGEFGQRVFLCLGLIGGALQGLLAAYSLMSYDERNCVRYRETSENLDDLASRPLDEARYAAATGDKQRVYAFYALVDEQISSEHREWVGLRTIARDLSLDRLRELRLPMVAN